jgi:hypothetical protein
MAMEPEVYLFKDTKFGKSDLVWNVPQPQYDFNQHISIMKYANIENPYQLDSLVLERTTNETIDDYDYLRIYHQYNYNGPAYYFITSIRYDNNIMILSLTIDIITTYNVLNMPISGTIVRRHIIPNMDSRFDYPTALNIQSNYENEVYDVIGYTEPNTKLIESTINLKTVAPAKTLTTSGGETMVIPVLPKPEHVTTYQITSFGANLTTDSSNAFTLYLHDLLNADVLNTVRGLSGDGAISDSYMVPTEAITTTATGSEVTNLKGRFLTKTSSLKLEIDFAKFGTSWRPKNKAVEGMFKVAITSMQEKTRVEFPAWDLRNSVDEDNFIKFNLWCDPKPSGAPYCCPDQVETLYPNVDTGGIVNLATLEVKSVRGGQWLRNPLIYSTGRGEIFSTAETQLQRERADYEKKVSSYQLEMSQKERDIRIAQTDYQYESGLASSIISSGASLLSKNPGAAFAQGKGAFDSMVNQKYVKQLQDLQAYEHKMEKNLIAMAYSNNLKNLNVQEAIRRVVPREVAYGNNESMGSYAEYNSFTISIICPDIESLKAKDIEYTLYGYPVYETVNYFQLNNSWNYMYCFTVFQFINPIIFQTGIIGDTIKEVLQAGIRIIHKPFTPGNILNNNYVD